MTGLAKCIFTIIVVAGVFILAMGLGDISIQALTAARALQQTGKDMSMIYIMNLFPQKSVCCTLSCASCQSASEMIAS